jgi:hypothetical protein
LFLVGMLETDVLVFSSACTILLHWIITRVTFRYTCVTFPAGIWPEHPAFRGTLRNSSSGSSSFSYEPLTQEQYSGACFPGQKFLPTKHCRLVQVNDLRLVLSNMDSSFVVAVDVLHAASYRSVTSKAYGNLNSIC